MHFRKIVFKNYRQFRNAELVFGEPRTHDIHLIIGKNGTGKTNILNAINWCLYGDELHLHLDSQKLPIYNTATEGNLPRVTVELWLSREDGKKIAFGRERRSTDEVWVMIESSGGFERYSSPESFEKNVNRFIPKEIRSFFFFDGESLDTYFRNFQAVQGKINQLARIDVLEGMKKRFEDLLRDLSRGTDVTGELKAVQENIEKLEGLLAEYKKRIEKLQDEKTQLEEDIKSKEEILRDQPKVRELAVRLKNLEEQRKKVENDLKEKYEKKRKVLIQLAKVAYLGKALQKVLQLAREKRQQDELPPPVNVNLLKEALREEKCPVCQRIIDPVTRSNVENIMKQVEHSSLLANRLLALEQRLYTLKRGVETDVKLLQDLTKDIERLNENLKNLKNEIGDIKNRLSSCDVESIRRLSEELEEMKKIRDSRIEELGKLKAYRDSLEKKLREEEKKYDDLARKRQESEQKQRMYEICCKAKKVLVRTKERVLEEIQKEIEQVTREVFFRLLWKKESFKDVKVKQDYTIEVLDRDGRNCLGSLSAAERELLALSFTLALHSLSGFQGPLVIDTPLARVSDEHRENFAEALLEVSKSKQIVLLLTPAEFSEEVSRVLQPYAATIRWLRMSNDERETSFAKEPWL